MNIVFFAKMDIVFFAKMDANYKKWDKWAADLEDSDTDTDSESEETKRRNAYVTTMTNF